MNNFWVAPMNNDDLTTSPPANLFFTSKENRKFIKKMTFLIPRPNSPRLIWIIHRQLSFSISSTNRWRQNVVKTSLPSHVAKFSRSPFAKSSVAITIFSMIVDLMVFSHSAGKYVWICPFQSYFCFLTFLIFYSGCIPLKNISNGIVQTYKTRDDKVIYKFRCNSGFFLNGSTAISCFRGQRNGSTPSCLQGKEIFVW